MNPLVSIITPAYNQANYLRATIESVLMQDYPTIEYIVIDDGSSDDSLEVAQSYAERGVKVYTQANCGQAATLNKGWALAKGHILAYLSSDDRLLPDAVSSMVRALNENPLASVAYCDFWLIDAKGRRLRESYTEDFNEDRLCVDLICQPGPGTFFRRAIYDKTGGWNTELRQVPDFEFWLRAVHYGAFIRVPRILAEYRIHEGSASFKVMPPTRAEEIVRVVESFWKDGGDKRRVALARAYLLASRNHGQSGRHRRAFQFLGTALRLNPMLALEVNTWRHLIVGMLRRSFYKAKAA